LVDEFHPVAKTTCRRRFSRTNGGAGGHAWSAHAVEIQSTETDAAWYGGAPALPNHLAIARFVFLGN
jgi:hypothetical protein